MKMENRSLGILEAALAGQGPDKADSKYLLELPADSLDIEMVRSAANAISRKRYQGDAIILGQIGIDVFPCPGKCAFCAFGDGHTEFVESRLSVEEISSKAHAFADAGDLFALFLMAMHTFEFDRLLEVVQAVRTELPAHTRIVMNIGDFDRVQARELKAAGASGAYHVLRLREGEDTALEPADRRNTFGIIKEAGLDLYYCCEPIGPEHSPEELVEQAFVGTEFGCFQHAVMRRVAVPGTPLAYRGQITEQRLAQICAIVFLASLNCPETKNFAVHEPNLIGLTSGANVVYAEAGINPRDTSSETSVSRGMDVQACRKMMYEAGFTSILRGNGERIDLTLDYIQQDLLLPSGQPLAATN